MILLDRLLKALVRHGPLTVFDARGRRFDYGAAEPSLRPVTIRLSGRGTQWRIARNPAMGFGEAYMDGCMTV